MLSQDVLQRISELNRRGLPAARVAEPSTAASTATLSGGEECRTEWGACWRICRPLEQLWPGAGRYLAGNAAATLPDAHHELEGLSRGWPDGVMFLDLETCGFAGSMIFLVGLLGRFQNRWELRQYLARDYSEEKAMLQGLWSDAARFDVLATFNGKSFDWPCVHDRSTLHRLGYADEGDSHPTIDPLRTSALTPGDPRPRLLHCDLLHHARRRWKGTLPNCRLQTLERFLCGRRRVDDIAGAAIPRAYHHFVRSGDAWQLRSILHHNALDLVTLLQITLRMLA